MRSTSKARTRRAWSAWSVVVVAGATLVGAGWGAAPAFAASPAGTVETGDPAAPADPTLPVPLDEPVVVVDDSVVEMPPPSSPELVPNANTVPMAWVGTPADRPADPQLLTLQAAINAAPVGGTVSFDPNDYAFTGAITIPQLLTLDSASASTLFARFQVTGAGLTVSPRIVFAAANTGAVVSVTANSAVLRNLTIRNPTPVLRPTGVQLAAGITGVVIDGLNMDGAGEPSSYGVNLATGSASVLNPSIVGVATGVIATAASNASGITIRGGTISAATSGVSLGQSNAPKVSGTELTGPAGTGTGVDLAQSSGAVVEQVTVRGFARGIGVATTNANPGPTITDPVVDGTTREGIALGATTEPKVVDAEITGADAAQSAGIVTLLATGAVIDAPRISGMMYGITTSVQNTGAGPVITVPQITAFGAITLGSTQGASVSGAVLDSGGVTGGTGVNLVNAGRATITELTATGYLYAVGSQSSFDASSDRTDISISAVTVTGAPTASHGIYLLGARNATITDVTAELTGAALVIHQSNGVDASGVTVTGHEGPTSVTGAAILRAYDSTDVNVDTASIDAGSYGFFYSATDGSTVTNATVANLVEYGVYGRSVSNLDVSAVSFTANSAVGLFVVTNPDNGISHDIAIHDSTMTGNDRGIHVLQGTTDVRVSGNTVTGQPDFVTAGPAHGLQITGNTVEQADDTAVAVTIAPLWQDGAAPGSYSSSGIRVSGNTFTGAGTWVEVGTADQDDPAASRRTLRDPVLVIGNSFDAGSTAIRTHANAVEGDDAAAALAPTVVSPEGPVAVDARDYDAPNDWDSRCRAEGYLDGELFYAGGGAAVSELTNAPVLYPMTCIDLSLSQQLHVDDDDVLHAGDTLSWTLTPHNDGPREAPAGWSLTQLLPAGVELIGMSGDGYDVAGGVATSTEVIPAGEDGAELTVAVRISAVPLGATTMRNVAYVSPAAPSDLDGDGFVDTVIEQFGPLVVPTIATDTAVSPTDNDAQGVWAVTTGTSGGSGGSGGGSATPGGGLATTGAEPLLPLLFGLLCAAAGLVVVRRTHARRRGAVSRRA